MEKSLTFTGYTATESILQYLEEFEQYAAIKGFDTGRQRAVLEASLRGPAKAAFQEAVAQAISIRPTMGTVTEAMHLQDCKDWLRQKYHTEDMRQSLRDQLTGLYQGLHQSPADFYTKICHIMDLADYPAAAREIIAENTFVNGLHREISQVVKQSPIPLTLRQKVDYAQRYWTTENAGIDAYQQVLPEKLRETNRNMPVNRNEGTPMSQAIRPAQVNWQKAKENAQFEELATAMSKITAHLIDMDRRLEQRQKYGGAQRFNADFAQPPPRPCPTCGGNHWNRDCPEKGKFAERKPGCFRCGKPGHRVIECPEPDPRTCLKCGEPGHVASACISEKKKMTANVVIFAEEDEEEESDEDYMELYPVQEKKRPGRPPKAKTPYEKHPKILSMKEKEKQIIPQRTEEVPEDDEEFNTKIRQMIEESNDKDEEMRDSPSAAKLRKSRTYEYDAGADLLSQKINIGVKQFCEISPTAKQQMLRAIKNVKPGFEIVEVKSVDGSNKSSAYAQCQIEDIRTPCIIDSGAGGCIISLALLHRLGWNIEAASKQKINVATGTDHMPLGKVFDIPIQFGKLIIPIDALVMDVDSYDLIIGVDWLKKTGATVDFAACKMKIIWKDRVMMIPLDLERGIIPEIQESDDDDQEMYVVQFEDKTKTEFRMLTEEERMALINRNMQEQECPFCETKIYCAEQMCNCPWTHKLPNKAILEDHLPKRKSKKLRTNHFGRKELQTEPFLQDGPYSGKNPHPFAESTGLLWDRFWDNYPYIGKSHFRKNRWEYNNCYWDEIDPQDLWTVIKRSDYDDTFFDKDYHLTWKEDYQGYQTMHLNVIQFKREILNTIPVRRIENAQQKVYLTIQNDVKILPWETQAVDTLTIVEIPRGHFGRTHIE